MIVGSVVYRENITKILLTFALHYKVISERINALNKLYFMYSLCNVVDDDNTEKEPTD